MKHTVWSHLLLLGCLEKSFWSRFVKLVESPTRRKRRIRMGARRIIWKKKKLRTLLQHSSPFGKWRAHDLRMTQATTPTLADPSEPKTEPISAIASASPGINQDGLPAGQGVLPSTTRSQS